MTRAQTRAFFCLCGAVLYLSLDATAAHGQAPVSPEASLPLGVKAVWDLAKAQRDKTPTRERVCLNGLWRWQPGKGIADAIPTGNWGHFKVPGFWPGASNYIQEDTQTLFRHASWKNADVRTLTAAWHQREFTVPGNWTGRRIAVAAEYVNSLAVVFIDGVKAGEIRYPAGDVDISHVCKPGSTHTLSLLVVALPLKGVLLSYNDTNAAREVKGTVERRGLCGDVWLTSVPSGPRLTDVKIDTSFRRGEITVSCAIDGLAADASCVLHGAIRQDHNPDALSVPFRSKEFTAADLKAGRISLTEKWKPAAIWDIHKQSTHTLQVALLDAKKEPLDISLPIRFGFREFWIDGKDFYLNGTRLFLSAVPIDNAQLGARSATRREAFETMLRLKSFGINFVYMHNYGCQPGSHVDFEGILRAADDFGMLVGFSMPHFGHYDWKGANADRDNSYARHAEFYVRAAQNHPSVVCYSMSHNATGYDEDMNPDLIDGIFDARKDSWSQNNSKLALRAEAIVKALDPGRIVYHHSSGNLGSMHTSNFYLNFAPIQEVSDWFEHWSTKGQKPMFPVEYGVPFSWDWTMYRGWYQGERNFGSAKAPWEFCLAEWNAQFMGDRAYQISEREKQNLRFEAKQFAAGKLWQRWDYPHHVGARDFDERAEVFARYITENWRAFRTWGLSANSPWEYQVFWKLSPDADKGRYDFVPARDYTPDWHELQRAGPSADYTHRQSWQMSTDFADFDWVPTAPAQALVRNNMPLLAYIAGKPGAFTSRDHNFRAGETVEKQLIVINNSRKTVSCKWRWCVDRLRSDTEKTITVPTGEQERIAFRFELPADLKPGPYTIRADFRFDSDEIQSDSFTINVLPPPAAVKVTSKIAIFDPKGESAKLLKDMGVAFQAVDAEADLAGFDLLIVGKDALTPDGPGPDVSRVRDGLKVIVFEQTAKTLERRFGFRVAEYGLREVFRRVPDHPLLAGLSTAHLHDWRGEATILSPRLDYTLRPRYGPTVKWCDIDVPRVWRCGNRGNVASVLIEKPARGDFLSIIDGGYALQYSPLLEYREGKGVVLFCQMDVTGRTEGDPAAVDLARTILSYASAWKPQLNRTVVYAGEPAGKAHLEAVGLTVAAYSKDGLTPDRVLIVGPGGGKELGGDATAIAGWIKAGGKVLAIGLDESEVRAFLPVPVKMKKAEHIAASFEPPFFTSAFAGLGPADVHNRAPRLLNLIDGGAVLVGNGILAQSHDGNVTLCQLVPWHFDQAKSMNLKRTFRRAAVTLTRIASNLGAASGTPILGRFHTPVAAGEQRWLRGLYLDVPGEWDDPYRFFRW
jgi:beta-galactosidase